MICWDRLSLSFIFNLNKTPVFPPFFCQSASCFFPHNSYCHLSSNVLSLQNWTDACARFVSQLRWCVSRQSFWHPSMQTRLRGNAKIHRSMQDIHQQFFQFGIKSDLTTASSDKASCEQQNVFYRVKGAALIGIQPFLELKDSGKILTEKILFFLFVFFLPK